MKPGRLIAVILIVAAALWLWKNRTEIRKALPADSAAPAKSAPSDSQLTEATREAEKSSGTGITENMTPEQVRGVLGSPDDVESFTTEAGKPGEKWTYRQAHRMVIFENGIAVSIQPI